VYYEVTVEEQHKKKKRTENPNSLFATHHDFTICQQN